MSEDMYVKSNLTDEEIKKIVNQIVDSCPSKSIEPIIPNTPINKPKTRVKKLVTVVSDR